MPRQRATKARKAGSTRAKSDGADTDHQAVKTVAVGSAVFRPLKTAESVARDIVHDILAEGFGTGDSLPPEAAMMEQYGVSRESLREGLRLLETQGLIVIKRGPHGGPIVGVVDPGNLGRVSTLYFHMAGARYTDLFEAWVVAESMLAGRAARNPDADARREAMAPYLDARPNDPEELEEFVTMHTEFHGRLGALGNNRVLELTLRMYGLIVSHHSAVVDDPRHLGHLLGDDHRSIAKAVIAGHANRAQEAMESHVSNVITDARKQLGDKVNDYVEWL